MLEKVGDLVEAIGPLSFLRGPISEVDLKNSMVFESEYHENLAFDLDEKRDILRDAIGVWMFSGKELVGETYGIPTVDLGEEVEDVVVSDGSIYCYSTTIRKAWQKLGLGSILKAYWLGVVSSSGYTEVVGHAGESLKLNLRFGAKLGQVHQDWYKTGKPYTFYSIALR